LDFTIIVASIFASDIALIGGSVLALKPEIEKSIQKIPNKSFFSFGTPFDWLNSSMRFFTVSFFASLAYLIMNAANIYVGNMPFGSDNMLIFSITFLVVGVIFLIRIYEFIHFPYSDFNHQAARITYWSIQIGTQIVLLAFVTICLIFNEVMFYYLFQGLIHKVNVFSILFNTSVVISFIAMVPFVSAILFRTRDKFKIRDIVVMTSFFSPFIILSALGFMAILGFNP
jgi:hypothetical protein